MIKRIRFDACSGGPERLRAVRCTVLPELSDAGAPHSEIWIEWLADGALVRAEPGAIVVEELVLRGADWLAERWADGGVRYKHMALARRADGMSRGEFSDRWRHHAGQIRAAGSASPLVIPDIARGQAYVQNHPVVGGRYDAVNEVWFDELADLRTRVEWFEANLDRQTQSDLVRASTFISVREETVD